MKFLEKITYWMNFVFKKTATAMLAVLIITLTAGIITRYVFDSPFTWTEELATFLFIWIAFLGSATVTYEKRHVAVDFVTHHLSEKAVIILRISTNFLILVFLSLIVVGSFTLMPSMVTHKSVALGIPRYMYYVPVVISSFGMIFMYVIEQIEDFIKLSGFRKGIEASV